MSAKDFAALDPTQHRLAVEFAVDHRRYTFKSGDDDATGDEGCSLTEATQALGCASPSLDTAVQVKREIGILWQDTDNPPYTEIFNPETTAPIVWNAVQIMRAVDSELYRLSVTKIIRADLIAVHLNRVILYMVFRDPRLAVYRDHRADTDRLKQIALKDCAAAFHSVADYLLQNHPNDYLASFAKNRAKCRLLVANSKWTPPDLGDPPGRDSLFPNLA